MKVFLLLAGLVGAPPTPAALPAAVSAQSRPTAETYSAFQVKVTGRGRPLLLLTGLGGSDREWDATVARYATRYECHVVTLAGSGGVPAGPTPLLPAAQRELLAYVQAQRLDKPVLLGHSVGGYLALQVAAAAPERFASVVVLDALPFAAAAAQPDVTEAQLRQALPAPEVVGQQLAALSRAELPGLLRQQLAAMETDTARLRYLLAERLASDPATLGRVPVEMVQHDLRSQLSRLTMPVRVLGSDATARLLLKQPTAPAAACRQLYATQYAAVPHLALEMNATAGHFLFLDAPDWYFQQLDQVLGRPAPAGASGPRKPQAGR